MTGLLHKLRPWFPAILRSTHGEKIDVVPGQYGEFSLAVSGTGKDGPWSVLCHFSREFVFEQTYPLGPSGWAVVTRPCDHARGVIRKVLVTRGFL